MEIAFGASYSPLIFPRDEWDHDLQLMREANFNCIRIGDVHGSWDRIEPDEGNFEWEVLQDFYSLADSYGIDILLSTGASSPPLWLEYKYPNARIVSSRGEKYPLGASYHWACVNHPGFLSESDRYLKELIWFTKKQPNHFGWQISNEIGFPFMPAREKNELGLYCYCEHCREEFISWLQKKYPSLEDLTQAWSWSTTNFVLRDWKDVFLPESLPFSWSSVTRWMDWRKFQQHSFVRFAERQNVLIKELDQEHPTSINTFNFKGFDRFGSFSGLDQWALSEAVDHIGYDLYPGSGNKLKTRKEHISIFLDHGRSVSAMQGRDFWLHEVESGPIGGWVMGPDRATDDRDIENYIFESIGHHAKMMLFMPWREWLYQPLHWGALVDLKGKPTERFHAAKRLGQFIHTHEKFLANAKPLAARVALLESKENAIFFRGVDQEETLFSAQRGAYREMWGRGFNVDFLDTRYADIPKLSQYKMIMLPMLAVISDEAAQALERFVQGGGIAIGFSRCAALDMQGWYQPDVMHPLVKKIFGIKTNKPAVLENHIAVFNQNNYEVQGNIEEIMPEDNAQVISCYQNGQPAVLINRYGKGMGLFFASQAELGGLQGRDSLIHAVIGWLLDTENITSDFSQFEGVSRISGVDIHELFSNRERFIILCNATAEDVHFTYRSSQTAEHLYLIYPEEIDVSDMDSNEASSLFTIKGREVVVFKITSG